jgi:fucose 4-O-acetylase-like acetyltransferase
MFPLFPWSGFAFAGLGVGFILQSPWTHARETQVFFGLGLAGAVMIEVSRWLDRQPRQLYAVYDYWHTSPNFFLIRVGMLMVILTASYAWCRWGLAQRGFSPVIQLGQASLLVYWVHIEFVYGRVSILAKRAQGIGSATVGLIVISIAMVALAYARTHWKGWTQSARIRPELKAS